MSSTVLTAFSAVAIKPRLAKLTWSRADLNAPVTLERQDGSTWTIVKTDAIGGTAEIPLIAPWTTMFRCRVYADDYLDDEAWSSIPDDYFIARGIAPATSGASATVATITATRNERLLFLAEILGADGTLLSPAAVESVSASIVKVAAGYYREDSTPVEGWSDVAVPNICIHEGRIKLAAFSSIHKDGANFIWAANGGIPSFGEYVARVKFTLVGGAKFTVPFQISVK
ncbi:MAG: hypothetical protein HUK22_05050 [Thermoguttaceae bacterium]|nr:hypothetical protein [Thermoguttaceae bacterium]